MKYIINSFVFFALLFLSNCIYGQTLIPRDDVESLKVYDQLLVEKYPSFFEKRIVTDVYKLDDNYSRIEYNDNGVLMEELVYQREDTKVIIATLVLVAEESVPLPVIDAFEDSPESKYEVLGYFEINPTYGDPVYYAVEYKDGVKKERKYFSKFGRKKERPK